jgi:leucyl-tRNA synthetase
MLSDSPPDRDVIWTEAGVEGAHRFVQRIWRLVGEAADVVRAAPKVSATWSPAALALAKTTHKTLAAVEDDIEKLGFNRAVARLYEFVNAIGKVVADGQAGSDPSLATALSEAFGVLVRLIAPMMPHLAEECWTALGRDGLVATTGWPVVDRSLTVDDEVTLPIQINGKKRAEITVARTADEATVRAAVLALEAVQKALEGKAPKKVIVVPQRIVNVVA